MNNGFLKQSTASQSRLVGPFLDDTDFKTAETALTIANTDVKLSANGAAGANKNSGGGTHRNNGMYSLTFDATDTATVGELGGSVVVAGALPVVFKFVVLEEAVYDALFAASAPGYLQPTVPARTLDVAATGEAGIDFSNILVNGAIAALGVVDEGTLQSATGTTAVLRAALSLADDILNGGFICIYSGTGAGQSRAIDDFTGATDTVTVSPAWVTNPDNTSKYLIFRTPPASTGSIPDVNTTKFGGTTVTGRDLGASVLLSSGTGTGQLDFTSGVVKANLAQILGTALTETAGLLAGGFKKFFNVATPTGTVNSIPDAVAGASGGIFIAGTNAATTVTTSLTTTFTGNLTGNVGGNVAGSVGSLAVQAKADVNAEVVDALATDTYAEPGQGAPAATATLATKIGYLYKNWRNKKTQTSSTFSLYADDATTVDQKSTTSDDGTTATRGEIATGP
jgi:hypothetical protein